MMRVDYTVRSAAERKAWGLRQQAREIAAQAMRLKHNAHLWRMVDSLNDQADQLVAEFLPDALDSDKRDGQDS